MNVVVVTDRPTPSSPARRRALRVARQLAAAHAVELLSLYDGDASGLPDGVTHRALLRETREGDAPVREHGLAAEQLRRVAVAPGGAEASALSRLAHVELHLVLSTSDADVVVVADGAMTPEVVDLAPASARVVTLHPGAPTPENLGSLALGDAVVSSSDEARHVLEGHFEQASPWVATEPLPRPATAPDPGADGGADDVTFVAVGELESPFLVTVVESFLEVTDATPNAHLRICVDGEPTGTLRRPISQRGRHGSIDFGPHHAWSGTPSAAAVVVGPSDDDESGEVAAEALARGLPVVVVGSCVASAFAGEPGVREVAADPASVQACFTELIARGSSSSPRPASPDLLVTESPDLLVTDERGAFWDGMLRDLAPVPSRRDRRLAVEAALALPVEPLLYGTPDLRDAEDALMGDHGDLVRWHGRVAEVDDTRLELDVWHRNTVDVAAALEQAGIAHVLISDQHEPGRFAVSEQDRAAVLGALAGSLRDLPVYVDLIDTTDEVRGTVLARQLGDVPDAPVLMVYRSVVTTSRTLVYGPNQGCAVEFWSQDPETRQHLSPYPTLTPTRRGPVLPSLTPDATITVADREVATTQPMLEVTNDDVTFPIDFVWTWLDDNDDEWRSRRDEVLKAAGAELSDPHVAARFVNRDELKYSMRSAAMYAPWVRHHYVVTDRQTPGWLDADHPDVTVVDHRDIFADPSVLPTFNSHAIESQLHHIPGISEHFVYFNDDFFLGRMLPPTMFFTPTGQACTFQSNAFIPPGPKSEVDRLFFAYRKNDRALFEREFGRTLRHGYLHAPYTLQVSLMEELEQKFAAEWEETMRSRFRSLNDHAFATCLVPAYAVETGRGIHKYIKSRYVRAGSRDHQPLMREILARRHLESFCLNDTGDNDLPADEHDTSMAAFMEAYYPVRAPWER